LVIAVFKENLLLAVRPLRNVIVFAFDDDARDSVTSEESLGGG
jgi:hypothetical protein